MNENADILSLASKLYETPAEIFIGQERRKPLPILRKFIWFQLEKWEGLNHDQIAQLFNRDRSTITYGILDVKTMLTERDEDLLTYRFADFDYLIDDLFHPAPQGNDGLVGPQ